MAKILYQNEGIKNEIDVWFESQKFMSEIQIYEYPYEEFYFFDNKTGIIQGLGSDKYLCIKFYFVNKKIRGNKLNSNGQPIPDSEYEHNFNVIEGPKWLFRDTSVERFFNFDEEDSFIFCLEESNFLDLVKLNNNHNPLFTTKLKATLYKNPPITILTQIDDNQNEYRPIPRLNLDYKDYHVFFYMEIELTDEGYLIAKREFEGTTIKDLLNIRVKNSFDKILRATTLSCGTRIPNE